LLVYDISQSYIVDVVMMVEVDQSHDVFLFGDFINQNKRSSHVYPSLILKGLFQRLETARILQYLFHFLIYQEKHFPVSFSKFLKLSVKAPLNRKFIHFPNHISCQSRPR